MVAVSGYVLAGGESSRMQRGASHVDKALLSFLGETLLERALEKVRATCSTATILGGPPHRCERLRPYGRVIPDLILQAGPLGALQAALRDAETEWVLMMPVDLPFLPEIALQGLLKAVVAVEVRAVLCYEAGGFVQPLPLVIARSALSVVSAALDAGERKLLPVLHRCAALSGGPLLLADMQRTECDWFANLNTPGDVAAAERMPFAADARPSRFS